MGKKTIVVPPEEREGFLTNHSTNEHSDDTITLISFGYKWQKTPLEFRVVDVRKKIRNPWHDPALRKLTGLDPKIQSLVKNCRGIKSAESACSSLFYGYMKKKYPHKYSKTFCFGCHGGRHRSVAVAEVIADYLLETHGSETNVEVYHLDLMKD